MTFHSRSYLQDAFCSNTISGCHWSSTGVQCCVSLVRFFCPDSNMLRHSIWTKRSFYARSCHGDASSKGHLLISDCLQATLDKSGGVLKLPLIKNKKTVNPRDSSSPAVFQLETAMGSAVECFDDAGAVVVPRERFAPVKTTNDLFALRSDAYKVC